MATTDTDDTVRAESGEAPSESPATVQSTTLVAALTGPARTAGPSLADADAATPRSSHPATVAATVSATPVATAARASTAAGVSTVARAKAAAGPRGTTRRKDAAATLDDPPAEAARAVTAPPPPAEPDEGAEQTASRIPPLGFAQVVCWQVALAALLFGTHRDRTALIVSIVVAVLALVPTVVWWRQRWLYRWVLLAAGFVRRSRRRRVRPADLPGLLVPGHEVVGLLIGDVPAAGLRSATGLATVLTLHAERGVDPAGLVPTGDGPRYSVQVIDHRRGADDRRTWLVLTAHPRLGVPDVDTDLVNRTRRLQRHLERTGVPAVVAGPDAIAALVPTLAGPVAPDDDTAAATADRTVLEIRERWRTWQVGDRVHVSAVLDDPAAEVATPTDAGELVVARHATAADDGRVSASVVVRVVADATDQALAAMASIPGTRPIQGLQGPGLRASLPAGSPLDIR